MKKSVFCILVVLFISVGCGGGSDSESTSTSSAGGQPSEAPPASSGGGEQKTLDPCALISDDEARTALGDEFTEVVSDENAGFVSCQWLGELKPGEGLPNLYIMTYTDQSISEFTGGQVGSAKEWWDNFYGTTQDSISERTSDTSYYITDETFGVTALIEEIPGLGEKAFFYLIEGTDLQLWMFKDYAAFSMSVSLRPAQEGQEKERLTAVAESILASMP
jgi:hypothetical protein